MSNKIFRGDSLPVAKVINVTPVSVVAGQTFTVWCNGKAAPYVAKVGDSPNEVAAGLAAAIAASSAPEFAECLASANGAILSIVAATAGIPFDFTFTGSGNVTVVETTAGQGATDEIHAIALLGSYSGGTFTITYNFGAGNVTTGAIAYNATAATVQAAIVALVGVGAGQCAVTGGPGPNTAWYVAFTGTLAGTAVAVGTINGASLTGAGSVTVTATQTGNGLSNCIQSLNLSATTSATYTLTLSGQTTGSIAYNATPATVQTAIQALPNVGANNCLVYGIGGGSGASQNKDYYWIVFTGALAGVPVATMTCSAYANNTGDPAVALLQAGGTATADDFQVIDLGGATSGTFTITFAGQTSLPIFINVGAQWANVREAIQAAAGWTVGGNTVSVYDATTPGAAEENGALAATNFIVHFANAQGNIQQPLISINTAGLTGASGPSVARIAVGHASVNQIDSIVIVAAGGTFTLTSGAQTTSAIAYNAASGTVQTRINADLSATITAATVSGAGTVASPYIVTITNPANTPITITASGASLTGGGTITEVVHGTTGVNEIQTITVAAGVSGGTFTLAFNGSLPTAALAYNATSAQVQSALRSLSTINTVGVSGSAGGPYTVTFSGAQAATNEPMIVADGSLLTGATTSIFTVTTSVRSAGPSHYDDPYNWTPVGLPGAADSVYFTQGSTDCSYGLDQLATFTSSAGTNLNTLTTRGDFQNGQTVYLTSATTLPAVYAINTVYYIVNYNIDNQTFQLSATAGGSPLVIADAGTGIHTISARPSYIEFSSTYEGHVGLPFENENGYLEYRQRNLHIGLHTTGQVVIGTGSGSGSGKIQLDTGLDATALKIIATGGSSDAGINAVVWKGTNAANTVNVISGDFGSCLFPGETCTISALTERSGSVSLGAGVTVGTIDKTGGSIILDGATVGGVVYAR